MGPDPCIRATDLLRDCVRGHMERGPWLGAVRVHLALRTFPCHRQHLNIVGMERLQQELRASLTVETPATNTPQGLDRALQNFSSDSIAVIFLAQGFKSWFAYFLATKRDNSIAHDAARLSQNDLKLLATAVAKVDVHESVQRRIGKIFNARRGERRARTLIQHKVSSSLLL